MPLAAGLARARRGQCAMPRMPRRWSARRRRWPHVLRADRLAADRQPARPRRVLALPSVILMMMFGQTRIFFVMSRDGLLPEELSEGPPEVQARRTSSPSSPASSSRIAAAFFPVGAAGRHLQLRHAVRLRDGGDRGDGAAQDRSRAARARSARPAVIVVAPLAIARLRLPVLQPATLQHRLFAGWAVIGLVVYFLYSRSHSHVGRGVIEVHEDDAGHRRRSRCRRSWNA